VIAAANSRPTCFIESSEDEIVVSGQRESARCAWSPRLADSIFQSELLMSDANFLRLFPEQGASFFLLEVAPEASSVQPVF